MSPHKMQSTCALMVAVSVGATINGNFQDSELFFLIFHFCMSFGLTHVSHQIK